MDYQERLKKDKQDFIDSLSPDAPEGCNLKIGDLVEWENEFGVIWQHKILGFQYGDWYGDQYGAHVILDKDSYWFPHNHATL